MTSSDCTGCPPRIAPPPPDRLLFNFNSSEPSTITRQGDSVTVISTGLEPSGWEVRTSTKEHSVDEDVDNNSSDTILSSKVPSSSLISRLTHCTVGGTGDIRSLASSFISFSLHPSDQKSDIVQDMRPRRSILLLWNTMWPSLLSAG